MNKYALALLLMLMSACRRETECVFDLSAFEGSTAEAGEPSPEKHPFAPTSSRVGRDPFVHFVSSKVTGRDIIRFWYPETQTTDTLTLDYEVLNRRVVEYFAENCSEEKVIARLTIEVFFKDFAQDYLKGKVTKVSFREIGTEVVFESEYR